MTTTTAKRQASLERRVRSFYKNLNQQNVAACYEMIDPQVREKPRSVTLYQYGRSLHEFMDRFGPLSVRQINITVHVDETNQLYQGRDFAIGKSTLSDTTGNDQVFLERWVRQGRSWYTRSTGFVTPALPIVASAEKRVSSGRQRRP